jgi:hypothetical protein
VRKKDTSLEKSLDLLEEGVRLANQCTELIDQQDWTTVNAPESATDVAAAESAEPADGESAEAAEVVAVVTDVVVADEDGEVVAEFVEIAEQETGTEFAEADDAWADESESLSEEGSDEPSADEG